MKRNYLSLFVVSLMLLSTLSFVCADNDNKGNARVQSEYELQEREHVGDYLENENPNLIMNSNGSQIRERAEEMREFQIRNQSFSSHLNLTIQNQSRIRVNLSNGMQREIKVLPEVAAERAREVFRSRNMTLVLKEVPQEENATLVYEAEGNRTLALFGLFKIRANLRTQIDAESGEVVETSRPWWSFLASSPEEN